MAKLVIEIEESGFVETTDIETFAKEAKKATGLNVQVGRPLNERDSHISRSFKIQTSDFHVRVEK